ncbi:alanine--glyoxylate aminotransferase [Apiospora phragmitis]|uniref:alanine--glyoxylate transaminase n=1 Tax=Apiospora phragmitis TaxID=2905665 RepID=A0ABR1WT20_9PEZI
MSSQLEHPTLLIPGPIEFDDDVLQSMSHYSESHVGPGFVATFGDTISMLRKLFQTTDPSAQPFVISGSGTLGWDIVAANLVEAGEDVLVLSTGYFGDGFADCFETYGAKLTKLTGTVGGRPQLPEIEKALKSKKFKMVTVTHVDTSTGVLSELENLSKLVKSVSPETLLVVDGVCSVACHRMPGRPVDIHVQRQGHRGFQGAQDPARHVLCFHEELDADHAELRGQEAVLLRDALAAVDPRSAHRTHPDSVEAAIRALCDAPRGLGWIKKAVADLGLKQVASNPEDQAHGMTAIYLPEPVKATDLLPKLAKAGVVWAGGIHKEIAPKYVRFGHMGVSVTDPARKDIDKAIKALSNGLEECGYKA